MSPGMIVQGGEAVILVVSSLRITAAGQSPSHWAVFLFWLSVFFRGRKKWNSFGWLSTSK